MQEKKINVEKNIKEEMLSNLLTLSAKHSVTSLVAESLSREGLLTDEGVAESYRHISYFSFVKWQQFLTYNRRP